MNQAATAARQTPPYSIDLAEVLDGLRKDQKSISPKYFYDEAGSQLFNQICELPEYYPTRVELGIMRDNRRDMASLIGPQASLIEFGSGSSLKTRVLLYSMLQPAAYVPVDISTDFLFEAARKIRDDFPELEVLPIAADFTKTFQLPTPTVMPLRNIVYFPGSTIGNFTNNAALDLLRVMHDIAGQDGALLIGVDLQKDVSILESAYNDASGITAKFNLNVLQRLNKEFDATFDLDRFKHRAIYNHDAGRIEMYLDSLEKQTVHVGGSVFEFAEGEAMLTEHSHKYTRDGFAVMAETAGFRIEKVWLDTDHLFSVQFCIRD